MLGLAKRPLKCILRRILHSMGLVMALWRYSVGRTGYNRVVVYERTPGGPLHIYWRDRDGRHRESLRTTAGEPVYDRAIAMEAARQASREHAQYHDTRHASVLLGVGQRHTLCELLSLLHKAREPDWAPSYKRNQKRMCAFWKHALGEDHPLPLPAGVVEDAARAAARAKGWTPRTHQAYLRYIVDAIYYGQHKLKWYGEQDNLSAVDFPSVQTVSRPYSKEEMRRLLAKAEAVDLRLAAWLHIAYDGARRATAIRTLRADAYKVEGDRGTIHFPGHTDKARRSGVVVLSQSGREVVERLLQDPAVKSSGLLFPGEWRGPRRACMTDRTLRRKLRALEELAGVESIAGRAMHGVKRRAATDAIRVMGVRAAAKQSGTSEATLQRHYDQDDLEDKAELADRLEALKRGKAPLPVEDEQET